MTPADLDAIRELVATWGHQDTIVVPTRHMKSLLAERERMAEELAEARHTLRSTLHHGTAFRGEIITACGGDVQTDDPLTLAQKLAADLARVTAERDTERAVQALQDASIVRGRAANETLRRWSRRGRL